MKFNLSYISQAIRGLCAALLALLCATLLAQQVRRSSFYQQSKLVTQLFSQDTVGMNFLAQEKDLDMLVKFMGAVTAAYIDFELIPVGEAKTFVAVLESATDDITLDRFSYQRKDLSIHGWAEGTQAYRDFVGHLQETGHFDSVSGHAYESAEGGIRFQVLCTAAGGEAYPVLAVLPLSGFKTSPFIFLFLP